MISSNARVVEVERVLDRHRDELRDLAKERDVGGGVGHALETGEPEHADPSASGRERQDTETGDAVMSNSRHGLEPARLDRRIGDDEAGCRNNRRRTASRADSRVSSARDGEASWHMRRLAAAPMTDRAIDDFVPDGRGEAVIRDDLDALAVHLREQQLSSRVDETDVRKLDADWGSSRYRSDTPPRTPELPDPFVLERSLQPQSPRGPAVRGHAHDVGDAQHRPTASPSRGRAPRRD